MISYPYTERERGISLYHRHFFGYSAIFILLICLLSVLCGCSEKPVVKTEPSLTVDIRKIGAADAILLRGTGETPFSVLIDTGEPDDAEEVLACIRAAGVSRLDCLILTHFDKDHIGSAPQVLSRIGADRVLMPAYTGAGEEWDALCASLSALGDPQESLTADTAFSFGEIAFSISVPKALPYDKAQDNNSSLVTFVTFGDHTLCFAGDAEKLRQEELLDAGLSHVSFLKVPHHGVWNKKLDVFLQALSPDYAVITCSGKNPPEDKVLETLNALGTKTYLTADGNIRVTCTRETMEVIQTP